MPRSRWLLLPLFGALASSSLACVAPPAEAPKPPAPPPPRAFARALEQEALASPAVSAYLDAIDAAVRAPEAPGALDAVVASLDALVDRRLDALEGLPEHAAAFRGRAALPEVTARLAAAWSALGAIPPAAGPSAARRADARAVMAGFVAAALHEIAVYAGDAKAAASWGARRGCASEASVVGPLDWLGLRALDAPSPIDPVAPLAASYRGVAPFGASAAPAPVHADACQLDINATSFLQGVRAVVVDLDVPRPQAIRLALTTSSAAVVDVGGLTALRRGFEAGGKPVTRLAAVDVPAGRVRVVARVAERNDGNLVELDAWGEDGQPLAAHAPKPGEAATARATAARPIVVGELGADGRGPDDDVALAAAALLGLGESRVAEHLLEPAGGAAPARRAPALDLLYARALEDAEDLPQAKMAERERAAAERLLASWPSSWEARMVHAHLTERRRGAGDGLAEALKEVGVTSGPSGGLKLPASPLDPMLLSFVAMTARPMPDLSEAAYAALEHVAGGSVLLASVDARVHRRSGPDLVKAACEGGTNRGEPACLGALTERGDFRGALAEIARLRAVRGAPDAFQEQEITARVQLGDVAGAVAVYDAMAPGERRMIEALGFAAQKGRADLAAPRLARDIATARDVPFAIAPLERALGREVDPARALEEAGKKLVAEDLAKAFLPGAGTAVLKHLERYAIEPSGLVRFTLYDLRRVSGTTDVAGGATAFGPVIDGRSMPRTLRRRIHKKDGRVLEPDAAAYANQFGADLSQLEQGDYVEQISEGAALPGDTGQLVLDTPDLLPERTSVREAEIEIRRPAKIPFGVWAHPLLGMPVEARVGDALTTTWKLRDAAPRRIEDGVPKMDRLVSVSLSTQTWDGVARAMDENLRTFDDRDPWVGRFAREAAGADTTPSRALVERVVAAVGKRVKMAQGGDLSDGSALFGGGPQTTTARTILEQGIGTRSWVVYRALRELGVSAEVAVAETEPYSASPDYPAHAGRFQHPLVIAHLGHARVPPAGAPPGEAAHDGDLWIDADVEGPPLPPGRISPELRGRSALLTSGKIVTVDGAAGEAGDEVDVRLKLDAKGDAHGVFTILLHGRAAQSLAEAFETVVGNDRLHLLQGVVLGWLPWADVEDVSLSSSEGSWEVALRAKIGIHGYARPEGKGGKTWTLPGLEPVHVVIPRGMVATLGQTYASRGARQSALAIEHALQYHLHRRIELPAGATLTRPPPGVAVKHARIEATRKGSLSGNVMEEDFALSLPTGTVTADGYQGFVEEVHAIDDGFMAGARVRVGP
jgi:hypothetical protein